MGEKIGPVILDLISTELSSEEKEILQHPLIGGVILFTKNYDEPQQLSKLCEDIRKSRETPLLIAVDQEGGRVQRFRVGFTELPRMGLIGKIYDQSKPNALKLAELCGWIMASEILATGIDLSFAPVLDLNKTKNPAIGDRAFHHEASKVIALGQALVHGMREAGMVATGKHFPGHGSVEIDSHLDTPVDTRTFDEIEEDDLQPFKELIRSGLSAIMPAHIIFSQVDKNPVGFSSHWLKEILRQQYQFTGMIFSDDLNMKGAAFAGDYPDRAMKALEAGCDMILICNNRLGAIDILDNLPQQHFLEAMKFKKLQGKYSYLFEELRKSKEWREKSGLVMRIIDGFQEFVI